MSELRASQSRQPARRSAQPVVQRGRPNHRPAGGAGYTIAHAGRQVRFGPVAFWIVVGTVVILACWSVVTASYFAFHDDVLKDLLARQTEQQYAYEDRIAELRAQIDRTTSRQLLDQEQFEQKLETLLRRQAALETRATALNGISEPANTGSIRAPARGETNAMPRPSRIGNPFGATPERDHRTSLQPESNPAIGSPVKDAAIDAKLGRVEASLDRVERHQTAALREIEDRYQGKARRLRGALAGLGLRLQAPVGASGGPFVPIKMPGEGRDFERALTRVSIARAEAEQLSRALAAVPLRKPITGEIEVTSTFGVRMDPFLRIPAMHTGVDFRGSMGEAIHATAGGTVTVAGWSGGYGKMVEVDHGNGLSTRYGHLSAIDVTVGQTVRTGQVVGRMGSTGRSTGPHVHYETRIDGEAVDPQKFLNAGERLLGGS